MFPPKKSSPRAAKQLFAARMNDCGALAKKKSETPYVVSYFLGVVESPFASKPPCGIDRGMNGRLEHLNEPVLKFARKDFPLLKQHFTVREALDLIREKGVGEKIIYFYVVDDGERLAGVLPTRRLLTAALDQRLEQVMIRRVIAIPQSATVLEACELFVLHKFLAFPVVDEGRQVVGVVDV